MEVTYCKENFFGLFVRAYIDVTRSESKETTNEEHHTLERRLGDNYVGCLNLQSSKFG